MLTVSSGDSDQEMSGGKKIPNCYSGGTGCISASFIPSSINSVILHQKGLGLFTRSVEADLQTKLHLRVCISYAARSAFKRLHEKRISKVAWPFSKILVPMSSMMAPVILKIAPLLQKNFSFELFVHFFTNSLVFKSGAIASPEMIISGSVQLPHVLH